MLTIRMDAVHVRPDIDDDVDLAVLLLCFFAQPLRNLSDIFVVNPQVLGRCLEVCYHYDENIKAPEDPLNLVNPLRPIGQQVEEVARLLRALCRLKDGFKGLRLRRAKQAAHMLRFHFLDRPVGEY